MTGAAHLATRAAQRAGAGYVRLSTPGSDADPWAPTEAVVTSLAGDGWADAVLADARPLRRPRRRAPGLGAGARRGRRGPPAGGAAAIPTVVDGDGLRALGAVADAAAVIAERRRAPRWS